MYSLARTILLAGGCGDVGFSDGFPYTTSILPLELIAIISLLAK